METILIVDDEKNYLLVLETLLGPEGYEIITSTSATKALGMIDNSDLDLIITDMKMPDVTGMKLLERCKKINPDLPVIIMTAYGTIETAVEAIKKHAYDFITKPFQNDQLKLTVEKALQNYRLIKENKLLSEALSDRFKYGNIIGKSKPILKIYDIIDKVAQSKASVLISGEKITLNELPDGFGDSEQKFDVERFIPANVPLPKALENIEEQLIKNALAQYNNIQSHAAKHLGITKSLIQHKIKKYNITF